MPVLLPGTPIGVSCLSHNYIIARQSKHEHTYVYMCVCAKLPGTPLDSLLNCPALHLLYGWVIYNCLAIHI